ncbi:SDR family NAD(P)-dependent oxidoreductase [Aspergillus ibericus CBS 121593]|uniref:Oxidoreductase n=1 Tax=Aspergillus ibericus CBS 121593 TaxID=1448316 RepID=A0A395GYW8_9EURO|nr:oxidoreductase [Aspergillus ibericus CBS 121593]RAL00791.1 oxidoreductase [Aspergillus ibericus CBS 121593]
MADSAFPQPISFTKTWHSEPYPFISDRPELSASGKNIVVTGGATGIGNAIAVAFAKAGAKSVSILGRQADKLRLGAEKISNAVPVDGNTQALHETADILDPVQLTAALQSIVGKVGKIDVFVANAGTVAQPVPLVDQSVDQFVVDVGDAVRGTLNSFQCFLSVAGPSPVLLHTSSCLANIAPTPGLSSYAVGKAASLKMLDYLAAENPHVHIVNVQPGWVATTLNGYQKEAPDSADLPGQFYVWLASPEAKFLKGKFVWANWDAQELLQRADEIQNSKLLNWIVDGVPM